ncbi:MAG TPA: hypothetical protein DCQ92_15180 [Verrucomicrobia subdivision 3 bacterium]|nr:hypothetical protein [Limisphaerales bacterium]
MMNEETKPGMNADEFEKRLQRQPLRQAPCEWRSEILAAARDAQTSRHPSPTTRRPFLSTLNYQLSPFFWPHPKAWAGLAAVWILIFMVNFSMHEPSPMMAKKSAPPSPEVIVELKKQQRMFAELVGSYETPDVDRRKMFSPRPRSGRAEILVA